jgi:hypothetical protein
MAKRKKTIELSKQNISYTIDNQSYKVIRFYQSSMEVDVVIDGVGKMKIGQNKLPFAHLPKEIKKLIKPN